MLNDSILWNESSIKSEKLELILSNTSTKSDKLESLPKSPSAMSELKVLPDA